jgi:hypothetical protein
MLRDGRLRSRAAIRRLCVDDREARERRGEPPNDECDYRSVIRWLLYRDMVQELRRTRPTLEKW